MIRRIARELVLQSLFQIDFSEGEGANALNAAIEERADKSRLEFGSVACSGP